MLGCLPEEVCTPGKLAIELIVQIISVSDDYDGGTLQCVLEIVGIENHGQGFPAALSMPEYTAFTVCLGSVLGRCNRLFHSKILVIPGKDFEGVLSVYIKTDKIFQDVQKAFFFK